MGPPCGLRGLIEKLRRQWWNPALSLEEELNRHNPCLGSELSAALRGAHSRGRWAVRAAFALNGPRAMEWLNEEPLRVVEELRQRVERLEQGQGQGQRQETGPGPVRLLGLEHDASPQAIKRGYWRLAKTHHPDLGGDVEAFRRIDAAYRFLVG